MSRDPFYLPESSTANIQKFFGNGGAWQSWLKPRGISMVQILCIGGGAGGGGGFTAAAGNNRGGGNGGGSAAITRAQFPAEVLPDRLLIQVGAGGPGGAATVAGTAGGLSYVSAGPSTAVADLFLVNGATAPAGGGAGTGGAGGAGGGGGSQMGATSAILGSLGTWVSIGGQGGPGGGAQTGAAGGTVTPFTQINNTAGAGGGGTPAANTNFAGGAITGTGLFLPTIPGGLAAGGQGWPGYQLWQPFLTCGGSGGGTNGAAGVGGAGGPGMIGSGGGGGGGGVTGGAGGSGGDGLVIIFAF